jgi:hypothetical protein
MPKARIAASESPSLRLGIGVHMLARGETPGAYQAENEQEGFLVLSGLGDRSPRAL